MQTLIKRTTEERWTLNISVTWHFIERYHERVWYKQLPTSFHRKQMNEIILRDIEAKLLDREKAFLDTFIGAPSYVQVPFAKYNLLIIKDNTLVTVYN